EAVRLKLLPTVQFRSYDAPVSTPLPGPFGVNIVEGRVELKGPDTLPPLRMQLYGQRTAFTAEPRVLRELLYRIEASRGYDSSGGGFGPGYFRADLTPESPVTLVASCASWEEIQALPPDQSERAERERRVRLVLAAHPSARAGVGAELVLAADQFLICPAARVEEAV